MLKKLLIIFILIFNLNEAFAHIDVVYPTKKKTNINANSTFFVGNTTKNADFYINNKKVNLWENNFFVNVVPLEYGKNKIKLKSILNGKKEEITYEIIRPKPQIGTQKKQNKYEEKKENEVLYTKTIKENSTVREKPSTSGKRIVDLQTNIILYLEGKQNDYYKIEEKGETEYWIHKSNIIEPVNLSIKTKAKLKNLKKYSDDKYDYIKFYLSHPVLHTIKEKNNTLELTLYGIENRDENNNLQENFKYIISTDKPILGYEGMYEENNFILKIAHIPEIKNENKILENIKIFIDAGHGGIEKGAIGPTRIKEKDINLAIANKLINELENAGAIVSYSRKDDRQVELYERVKIAKNNDALISISIHNNSLPNGKDPYIKHGTEVHYYNDNAKLLAKIIQENLSHDLNLKDGGIHKSSFALNRSTNPISVLIEVAYMINPKEYILLQDSKFQENVAKSIKKSIEKYIKIMTRKENVI